MNRPSGSERRVILKCLLIGACLTAIVIALEKLELLNPLEFFLDDRCALFCQNPSPQESHIVHVDIDDASIRDIGRWPWPRAVLADVVDELDRAGAKVIALDILLDQPDTAENDQRLRDAIRRSGRVLVPISIDFEPGSPDALLRQQLLDALVRDPEQSIDDLTTAISQAMHRPAAMLRPLIEREYLNILSPALLSRLQRDFTAALPTEWEVAERVTPKAVAGGLMTLPRHDLTDAYAQFRALRSAERFILNAGSMPLLKADTCKLPLADFLEGATASGYFDFVPADDGTVRAIPLLARLREQTFAHMSLAVACAAAGIPIQNLHLSNGHLKATAPDGTALDIPIALRHTNKFGDIASLVDISWQGRREQWDTMYDVPAYASEKQHVSLRDVYAIQQINTSIQKNDAMLRDELKFLLTRTGGDVNAKVEQLDRTWPTLNAQQRQELIDSTLANRQVLFYLRSVSKADPATLDEAGKKLLTAKKTLDTIPTLNQQLAQSIARQRDSLHNDLNGKVALIGMTATGHLDFYKTPLHAQCPGVVIQGAMINAILNHNLKQSTGPNVAWIQTLLAGVIASLLGAFIRPVRALFAILFLTTGYLAVNGFVYYARMNLIIPMAGVTVVSLSIWIGLTLYRFILESAERARVIRRFRSHVDPRVVDYFLEHHELSSLRGERREMTVVFTDLQGFTSLAERLKEEVVGVINEYMGRMLPVIRANEGTWDKFIGDGIMFFFNAPIPTDRHAAKAVTTALQMQEETAKLSADLQARNLPPVTMRAGMCTGLMIVGDAGSLNEKFYASSYTVLGDLVNLASRLESANKLFGTRILVNAKTMHDADDYLFRAIARLRVYGKNEAVEVYEPIVRREQATEQQLLFAQWNDDAVALFRKSAWQACLEKIGQIEQTFGISEWCNAYQKRIDDQMRNPGGRFDDAFDLGVK